MGHAEYGGLAPENSSRHINTTTHAERVEMRAVDSRAWGDADDNNQNYFFGDDAGVDAKPNFARISSVARGSWTPYRQRRPAAKRIFVARIRV